MQATNAQAGVPLWVTVSLEIVREHLRAYRQETGRDATQELVDAFQHDQLQRLHAHLDDPQRNSYTPMTLAEWEAKNQCKG